MSNDVIIRVRVRQDARDGFAAVGAEAQAEGRRSGEHFTRNFGTVLGRMGVLLQEQVRRAGQSIGQTLGDHSGQSLVQRIGTVISSSTSRLAEYGRTIGQRISTSLSREVSEGVVRGVREGGDRSTDRVSGARSGGIDRRRGGDGGRGGRGGDAAVDVDVDKQSFLSRFASLGKDAASGFFSGFSDNIRTIFGGDVLSMLLKGLALGGLAAALAVPLSAAITTAVGLALGGAGIAAGVVAAFKDPIIMAAAKELGGRLNKAFEEFGKPFRGPVADFLEKFTRDFLPQLELFGKRAGQIFAPLTGRLGDGIIGALQNLLPGLLQGMENIQPIIEVLAKRLPDIGQAIGDFFRVITENSDDAAVFFNDLITFTIKVINATAHLVNFFTGAYKIMRGAVIATVETLRNFWNVCTEGTQTIILAFFNMVRWVARHLGDMVDAAAAAFSWIPGIGPRLAAAKAAFAQFRIGVNNELAKIKNRVVKVSIEYSYRTFGKPYSDIDPYAARGYAHGGIVGGFARAATGGIRNGLTLVGENGPELADLAPGTRVSSNGDTRRMLAAAGQRSGGDGQWMEFRFVGNDSPIVNEIMSGMQFRIRREFSGNVQSALGS